MKSILYKQFLSKICPHGHVSLHVPRCPYMSPFVPIPFGILHVKGTNGGVSAPRLHHIASRHPHISPVSVTCTLTPLITTWTPYGLRPRPHITPHLTCSPSYCSCWQTSSAAEVWTASSSCAVAAAVTTHWKRGTLKQGTLKHIWCAAGPPHHLVRHQKTMTLILHTWKPQYKWGFFGVFCVFRDFLGKHDP